MMKRTFLKFTVAAVACLFLCNAVVAQSTPKYKNAKLGADERTKDLISRMTLEEKVGQLLCPLGWEMYEKKGNEVTHSAKFEEAVTKNHIGMLWATLRADPWTKKTLETGLNPELAAKVTNALQKYIIENSRLGIPIFLAEECPHGHMAIGTTVYPTAIGQASTWNPILIEKMSASIAKEARLQGSHIGYGPVLDLAREPRWSRTEETYGEDPILVGRMGESFAKGFGGGDLKKEFALISTLKHFVAYGVPEGGHNGSSNSLGLRSLKESYLPPFEQAVKNGALSVMTAYNSVDGVPCTSNKYILRDVLQGEWNFKGFTVSDLGSIEGLKNSHGVVATIEDAAVLAVSSGVDVDLGGNAYVDLVKAVKSGKLKESIIDEAAYRVLKLKFEMGLFENPYVDPAKVKANVKNAPHELLAKQVARESIVLLENKNNILPLDAKKINRVAVVGPNADNIYNQIGDYSAPQSRESIKTVLDGVKSKFKASQIEYVKGCAIRDTANTNIDEAVKAAQKADVTIVVVGGSSARDFETKYLATGAAITNEKSVSDMESGEGYDRASLELMGRQMELLKAIKKTGKRVVVVYIQGRPLDMRWASENADALLTAFYPGQEGGAVADVIFGDYNPAGRLPISVPFSVGQSPVYYSKRAPSDHEYVDMTSKPLYSFGYGLSFTQFEYSNLAVTAKGKHSATVSVTVKNSGKYDGDEVVQLYLRNKVAQVVQPLKQLRSFERINLKKGESKTVSFTLNEEDFSIIDLNMNKVVEPNGQFSIMVGGASNDVKLQKEIETPLK